MKKISIIGHFGIGKNFNDGQTVKTKEIYNFLIDCGYNDIQIVDTYGIKKKFIQKMMKIKKIINSADVVILIVSSRGYKILVPVLSFFKKNNKPKYYDFVIGGSRYKIFEKHKRLMKKAMKFNKIYVETNDLKNKYDKFGFQNVEVLSNFKQLDLFPPKIYDNEIKKINLCTFSRVCKSKGITDSINAVKLANEINPTVKYHLDIYGSIESDYIEEFNKLLSENETIANYCGVVPFNQSSAVLSKYDILLFLTFWVGEGFAGTLIDCFFASTPVIATDWNFNFEILNDKKTGIKVNVNDEEDTAKQIVRLSKNLKALEQLSKNCYETAKKYLPENVMKPFLKELENNE